jgi:hypothetical protein
MAVLSLSTLDNNITTTFSFVSPRYRCCIAIFVAQQQDLFPFLIITLYYEYQLGADTARINYFSKMSGEHEIDKSFPYFEEHWLILLLNPREEEIGSPHTNKN